MCDPVILKLTYKNKNAVTGLILTTVVKVQNIAVFHVIIVLVAGLFVTLYIL